MWSGYQRKRIVAIVIGAAAAVGFVLYAQTIREDNSVPAGPPELAGRILMEKRKCLRCHRIAGSGGLVGPDLTVVSRKLRPDRIEAILIDPRAVDPKAKMPRPRLTAEQRSAVLAYLETLDGRPHPIVPPQPPVPPEAR